MLYWLTVRKLRCMGTDHDDMQSFIDFLASIAISLNSIQ